MDALFVTTGLRGMMEKMNDRDRATTYSEVEDYVAALHKLSRLKRVRRIHQIVDLILESDRRPISCTKGCAHCCHIYLVSTPDEVIQVADYVQKHRLVLDFKYLETLAGRPETEHWRSRCPLLTGDNLCSIYPVRPAVSRSYRVSSPPEMCDAYADVCNVRQNVHRVAEVIISAGMNMPGGSDSFFRLLWNELKKRGRG